MLASANQVQMFSCADNIWMFGPFRSKKTLKKKRSVGRTGEKKQPCQWVYSLFWPTSHICHLFQHFYVFEQFKNNMWVISANYILPNLVYMFSACEFHLDYDRMCFGCNISTNMFLGVSLCIHQLKRGEEEKWCDCSDTVPWRYRCTWSFPTHYLLCK